MGLQELLMGVETPIPPEMINAAAPDGAPSRRLKKKFADLHGLGMNPIGSCAFILNNFLKNFGKKRDL